MKPSEALEKHRDTIREILSRYPVSNPRLFGSVAREEDTEASDLDIVVKLDTGSEAASRLTLFDLARLELERLDATEMRVDVGPEDGFGPRMLKRVTHDAIAL